MLWLVAADRAGVPDGEHVPLLVVQEDRPAQPAQLHHVLGIALLLLVWSRCTRDWCLLALATLFWLSGPLAYLGRPRRSGAAPDPPPVVAASEAP